jgi:hypothetical protein
MGRVVAVLLVALAGFWTVSQLDSSMAAVIEIDTRPDKSGEPFSVITVEGKLDFGDEKKFIDTALRASRAVVLFNSVGGNTYAGIEIGKAIRLKGFGTFVPNEFVCASACALAWLGGIPRMMSEGSHVGFHATYVTEDGELAVSAPGNAAVGAYLAQLGLPQSAIFYMSEAQPSDMQWLTFSDARRIGLEVETLELPDGNQEDGAKTPPPQRPVNTDWARQGEWIQLYSRENYAEAVSLATEMARNFPNAAVFAYDNGWYVVVLGPYPPGTARALRDALLSQRAIPDDSIVNGGSRFVDRIWPLAEQNDDVTNQRDDALASARDFFAKSSAPAAEAMAYLDALYAPHVSYFGKLMPKAEVMADKQRFVARWPVRLYDARPGGLVATCVAAGRCTVTGTIDFRALNPTRNEISEGTAQFELTFNAGFLVAESSKVISRRRHAPGKQR